MPLKGWRLEEGCLSLPKPGEDVAHALNSDNGRMNVTQRQLPLVLMVLGLCFAFVSPAQAQRSGFIIGGGLGLSVSGGDLETKLGVASDLHIGGVVGSVELFYVSKVIFTGDDFVDLVATGVSGLGVAYPLNPDFAVTGAIGVGVLTVFDGGSSASTDGGLGLLAGGRYKLNESGRWMLNFDISYINPEDISIWGVQVTINIMSH